MSESSQALDLVADIFVRARRRRAAAVDRDRRIAQVNESPPSAA